MNRRRLPERVVSIIVIAVKSFSVRARPESQRARVHGDSVACRLCGAGLRASAGRGDGQADKEGERRNPERD